MGQIQAHWICGTQEFRAIFIDRKGAAVGGICSGLRDYPKTSTVILREAKDLRESGILSVVNKGWVNVRLR